MVTCSHLKCVFKTTECMKNASRLTYILESLWDSSGKAYKKHTSREKKKQFLTFLLAIVLSESDRGRNVLDGIFSLDLILP